MLVSNFWNYIYTVVLTPLNHRFGAIILGKLLLPQLFKSNNFVLPPDKILNLSADDNFYEEKQFMGLSLEGQHFRKDKKKHILGFFFSFFRLMKKIKAGCWYFWYIRMSEADFSLFFGRYWFGIFSQTCFCNIDTWLFANFVVTKDFDVLNSHLLSHLLFNSKSYTCNKLNKTRK